METNQAVQEQKQTIPSPAPEIHVQKSSYSAWDRGAALLIFVCGYLFVRFVFLPNPGVGTTLFALCFYAVAIPYLYHNGAVFRAGSCVLLVVLFLSAACFAVFSDPFLRVWNLLFFILGTVYWVGMVSEKRIGRNIGQYLFSNAVEQLFYVPFGNFGEGLCALFTLKGKKKKHKTLLAILLGLLLAVPLLMVVLWLLMSADGDFRRLIATMFADVLRYFPRVLLRIPFALLVGCYLFGLLYGSTHWQKSREDKVRHIEQNREARRIAPAALTGTILAVLCLVYMMFFISQATTLFSALYQVRPDGFTYAEYARHGFFELCLVAAINFVVLVTVRALTLKDGERVMRVFSVLLSLETLLLIVTALSKMVLYISQYGLTRLRIFASCTMIVLFLIFFLMIIFQFKKFNIVRTGAIVVSVAFLALCYANVGGMAARYNIARYQAGQIESPGVEAMYETPEASLPAAIQLYQAEQDPLVRADLKAFIEWSADYLDSRSFSTASLQRLQAMMALKDFSI
ncbi:DUF4173 domain-containing protein [Hydrogeniiclostridium mannosilyticum]|uniref:DUF4153 domain-containing protein n=1 Tax=Hydrogeniiclostridium mannosilyticum TaxID=2764322 RepID=UPI0018ABD7F2|nr:DUF4173 domain-containing protein [Hydrogeniiclostridium mannosilyticum]